MKNLINLWTRFMRFAFNNQMTPTSILVYQCLLYIDNELMYKEWFGCSNSRLQMLTGYGNRTVIDAKNKLKQSGWIDFKAVGKRTTLYKLCEPPCVATHIPKTQDTTQDTTQLNRQYKTRPDLPEEAARVCEDVPVIPPRVKQAFEQTFRPILPQDLDRLSAMVRDYGELSMVSAIRAAKERGGRPPVREPLSWLGKVLRTRLSQTQTQAEREEEYQPPECRASNPFIGMSREEYLSKCRKLYGEETFERMMRDGQI